MTSRYANVDGDEVLFEAATSYAEEFENDKYAEDQDPAEILKAVFMDGARWAIKNFRVQLAKPCGNPSEGEK